MKTATIGFLKMGIYLWRNQNPGDLKQGDFSRRNGSIGSANGFAVFPDYDTGHAALIDLLKDTYANRDIPALMKAYAPPKDKNKTKRYIKFIEKLTGVKGNKKIKNFTPEEFEKLWKAIEKMEGWGASVGTIQPIVAISPHGHLFLRGRPGHAIS